jgi:hypothetical protein
LDATRVGEGQQLVCEFCGQANRTPVTVPGVKGAFYELLDGALADMPASPPPPPRKRKPWFLIAAGVLGLFVFVGTVLLLRNALRQPVEPSSGRMSALQAAAHLDSSDRSASDESSGSSDGEPEGSDWKPDRAVVERLGWPPVHLGKWIWRLPEGFEPTGAPQGMDIYQGVLEAWAWSAGDRDEELLAAFHLDSHEMKRIHDPARTHVEETKLQLGLLDRLEHAFQVACNLRELKFTPRESGRLARREFQWLDFAGVAERNDSKVYGEILYSRHERSLLVVLTISPHPPGDERHAEILAAALTLD